MLKAVAILLIIGSALADGRKAHTKQQIHKVEWEKPAFCGTNDCPVYTVLDANAGEQWEMRSYEKAMWVSTEVSAIVDNVNEQLSIAFDRLFDYISGENERGEVINMTTPVTTKVLPGEGPNCNSYFTRSFYLPYGNQADPPKPTNPLVFLEEFPAATIYAEMFTGYAEVRDYIAKTIELSESVGVENHETAFYYMTGYDGPFQPFDRHNEAWLVAK